MFTIACRLPKEEEGSMARNKHGAQSYTYTCWNCHQENIVSVEAVRDYFKGRQPPIQTVTRPSERRTFPAVCTNCGKVNPVPID